jgi:hypothetical protein
MGRKDQQSDPQNVTGTRKLLVADIECVMHHAVVQPPALLAVGGGTKSQYLVIVKVQEWRV